MEHQIWAYLIAITLLTITPGVDTMLVVRNTTRGGWRDGFISSLGICSGLFVHAVFSAVGISVVLFHSAWAFGILKLFGAGYLVWLGCISLRNAMGKCKGTVPDTGVSISTRFVPGRSLREGFLSNVLNPKTAVFYMAFLPQFIDPSKSALQQSLILASIHFVIAMAWQCFLSFMVARANNWLVRPHVRKSIDALTGSFLVLFGINLALDR